ncbi:MAG: hypothetical protein AAF772_15760 [Acidobacteriota bacterium]
MTRGRLIPALLLVIAYVLHNDVWLRDVGDRWFGLPAGLAYHALFCLLVVGLMAVLMRFAWPAPALDQRPDNAASREDA